jgi:hypothetical protein
MGRERLSQAWNPLDKACRVCTAKAGERCRDHFGREIDTHRSRG